MTRSDQASYTVMNEAGSPRLTHSRNPKGQLGGFLDIGMAHFPMTGRKKTGSGKSFEIDFYYDWGLGVQMYRGKEINTVENFNTDGDVASASESTAKFSNTYATGRFSAHHNTYFGKQWFLDQALGLNFDYRFATSGEEHEAVSVYPIERYQNQMAFQIHYGIGAGYKNEQKAF